MRCFRDCFGGHLGALDGGFGACGRLLRIVGARASELFVVRVGREPQRVNNQMHDVRLSALVRVIE